MTKLTSTKSKNKAKTDKSENCNHK